MVSIARNVRRFAHPKAIALVVALLAGGAASFAAHQYLQARVAEIDARGRSGAKASILVAKTDLSAGALLNADTVAIREMPQEWVQSNALRPIDFDRVANQRLTVALKSGEPVLSTLVAQVDKGALSSRVPAGRRAITVPVDEVNALSGMLEPGDYIDVILSVTQRGRRLTYPLLQRVRVIATGRQQIDSGATQDEPPTQTARAFTTVTLDTTPQAAQQLIAARQLGTITALLRHPDDPDLIAAGERDASRWVGIGTSGTNRRIKPVQVIYGGRGRVARIAPLADPTDAQTPLNELLANAEPDDELSSNSTQEQP